jgi:hypothetical protein
MHDGHRPRRRRPAKLSLIPDGEMTEILTEVSRLGMKHDMMRCFCHIATVKPKQTFDNFARDFGERLCPGERALLVIDFLMNASFDERCRTSR